LAYSGSDEKFDLYPGEGPNNTEIKPANTAVCIKDGSREPDSVTPVIECEVTECEYSIDKFGDMGI